MNDKNSRVNSYGMNVNNKYQNEIITIKRWILIHIMNYWYS